MALRQEMRPTRGKEFDITVHTVQGHYSLAMYVHTDWLINAV